MIDISFGSTDSSIRMLMRGHARNDSGGDHCVCAACSSIAYALLCWVSNQSMRMNCCVDDGFMYVQLFDVSDVSRAAYEVAELGLRQIAKQYPEYVSIKDF